MYNFLLKLLKKKKIQETKTRDFEPVLFTELTKSDCHNITKSNKYLVEEYYYEDFVDSYYFPNLALKIVKKQIKSNFPEIEIDKNNIEKMYFKLHE